MSNGMAGLLGGLIGLLMTLLGVAPPLVWYHWGSIKGGLKQLMSRIDRLKEKKRKAKRAGFLLEPEEGPVNETRAGYSFDDVARALFSMYQPSYSSYDPNKSISTHGWSFNDLMGQVIQPPPKEVRAQRVVDGLLPLFAVVRQPQRMLWLGMMTASEAEGALQECSSPGYHRQLVHLQEVLIYSRDGKAAIRQYRNIERADLGFPQGWLGGIGYALEDDGPIQGWAKLSNPMIGTAYMNMSISPGDFSIDGDRLDWLLSSLQEPVLQAS